ncbi:MAG: hypothetical protein ACREPE_07035 [Lysobacter sp.]
MSDDLWDDLSARITALKQCMPALMAASDDNEAQRKAFTELAGPIIEAARGADELFQDGVMMMLDEILIEYGLMAEVERQT